LVVVVILAAASVGTPDRRESILSLGNATVSDFAVAPIQVELGPWGVAFDPVNNLVYVSNFGSGTVSVINTTTDQDVKSIPVPVLNGYGNGPIAVNTATGVVYVGDGVGTVYGIDPSTNVVAWTIPLAPYGCPYGCGADVQTYDPANGDIYVTNIVTNNVTVIHGTAVVATIPVGAGPNGAAYDSANGEIFVSNEGSSILSNLTVIDGALNRVVGQVYPVSTGPGVAYDDSNGNVYVCSNNVMANSSNFVTVVNGTNNRVVASIPISSSCGAAVYDPNNGYVYITDRNRPGGRDQSNITIIDPTTNSIVLSQPVQLAPIGIAYDSANHDVYVANGDSGTVSVPPQVYRLTVRETGLPNGTNWSATVGGATFTSTTPSITFPETNGTFNFTIGHQTNRSACPSSGTVTVAGGPRELNVTFSTSACAGSNKGLFGLPGATGYYVLGGFVVVIVAAVAVVIVLTRRKRRASPPAGPPPTGGPSGQVR
jgi:YVTN family beta-propeller protein